MKYIILGIKDWCKDTWHDFLVKHISKYYVFIEVRNRTKGDWYPLHKWKEGSVWHYIRQRKIANNKKVKHKE